MNIADVLVDGLKWFTIFYLIWCVYGVFA